MPRHLLAPLIGLLAVAGAACGSDDDEEQSAAQSTAAAEAADACAPDQMALKTPGTLTIGTDKPAYPPYFEDDDPSNGKGCIFTAPERPETQRFLGRLLDAGRL